MTQYGSVSGPVCVQFRQSTSRGRCTHYNGALPDCGLGKSSKLLSSHLQHRGVKNCVCMCVSVIVLSFNPLQHSESWKLLPDIHKQWPRKTMKTRCLGSFHPHPMSPCATACKAFASSTHPFSSSNIRHRPRCGFM